MTKEELQQEAERVYPKARPNDPGHVLKCSLRNAWFNGATSEVARKYWEQQGWVSVDIKPVYEVYTVYDPNELKGWRVKSAHYDPYNDTWHDQPGNAIHPTYYRALPSQPNNG
jgi:hypothetical protein